MSEFVKVAEVKQFQRGRGRLVDVGATFRAGQMLARLDPTDMALQAAQAEANRALAEAEARRYRDLTARQFVSQSALDARETALKAAEAQTALAHNQAAYATLSADHAGVITAVLAESGQVVAAGQPVLRAARTDEKEAVVGVPEGRVEEFRAAKALTVTPWALPNLHLAARLRELSPLADPATRTYAARLSLVEHNPALQLGMTVRVSLPGAADADAALVPSTAVVDQGQGAAVWVVADGRAQRLPVKVLQQREDGVLLSGIHAGEPVVVVGAHKLSPGEAVRPIVEEEAGGRR
jgi:RND family efflux transporter MFP subunit